MLPSIVARQLEKGLVEYLDTTFPMTDAPFKDSFTRMIHEQDTLFHDPYFSVRLPFRVAAKMPECFSAVQPAYRPYVHQMKAFERLTGKHPRSTLVATGTGSGKTECFLYPILDYCYRESMRSAKPGIKAILLYPMNALASDQARRIASLINGNDALRGNVTAGMYIGGDDAKACNRMTADSIITSKDEMHKCPPDILLTNYKMLDYLLIRPEDTPLWKDNDEDTLKFMVVDEFHTFDGAQGTDLACLIRRLKKRLDTPEHYLCCVGTSATMGDKKSGGRIRAYAEEVFGEPFDEDSVVTEERLSATEFLGPADRTDTTVPTEEDAAELDHLAAADDSRAYLRKAAAVWLDDFQEDLFTDAGRKVLGQALMHLSCFQSLIMRVKDKHFQISHMLEELKTSQPFLPQGEAGETLLEALIALISQARNENGRPFLDVSATLWLRELRRLLGKVDDKEVHYALAGDLTDQQIQSYLPVVNCRDCGMTGWATLFTHVEHGWSASLGNDLPAFYNLFFHADTDVKMLYPFDEMSGVPTGMQKYTLCPHCLHVEAGGHEGDKCRQCGTPMMAVLAPNLEMKKDFISKRGTQSQYKCPFCGSTRGLSLMGLRSATEISSEMSQLFASRFNDDKKLLAFSDSVQDASQRAGFFNARAWRFCLRVAVMRYVQHGGDGMDLASFLSGFVDYCRSQCRSVEEYVSLFIAPNMMWMSAYEDMVKTGRFTENDRGKQLLRDIGRRLSYEVLLELGRTSSIGRTLEKSGCCGLSFHEDDVKAAARHIRGMLSKENKDGKLDDFLAGTTEEDMEKTVLRYLQTMKFYGAFADKTFQDFLKNNGKSYILSSDRAKWRPGVSFTRNIPRFLVANDRSRGRSYNFDHAENPLYVQTIETADHSYDNGLLQRISRNVLEGLMEMGLVTKMPYAEYDVFGINEEKVYISYAVTFLKCDICGTVQPVAGECASLWDGVRCPRKVCRGHMHAEKAAGLDYYGRLYETGSLSRINAREHTGLLPRAERETLEKDFKRSGPTRRPFDPNVLSCTPTLEMGIDIGDLDTVILCSIPPSQAQFLQRCGRAGRKDGNALILPVANARPHDLYFYADPRAMMEGKVDPPKIFLNASAVLARQLMAYCMDSWVKTGISQDAIPDKVGKVFSRLDEKIAAIKNGKPLVEYKEEFPFNFLYYVQNHLTDLLASFETLFADHMEDTTKKELADFAMGDGTSQNVPMQMDIYKRFLAAYTEWAALKSEKQEVLSYKAELEKTPHDSSNDEEITKAKQDIAALTRAIRDVEGKDMYGFLCDEGLLPNYAFPEEGITLRAVFTRKEGGAQVNAKGEEQRSVEYKRAASSALSEFAPSNVFYAEGHELTIDRIDVSTAGMNTGDNRKGVETWRLCPNCAHAELDSVARGEKVCPVCHDPGWADSGQKVQMIRPGIVYARSDVGENLIDDASENRTIHFYVRQMLVDVDEDRDIVKAYEMDNDEFPFGYEFARKATLREINFGPSDIHGEPSVVDDVKAVRNGFRICKYCGRVFSDAKDGKNQENNHTRNCPVRKNPDDPRYQDAIVPCMYLYREFHTEVLRILLPSTSYDATRVKEESFMAAFMLGMKEYFGNVDHIRCTITEVPTENGAFRKKYLVVYDSVPGGTGYLKQLMENKNSMVEILEKALRVMETCSCNNDPQKDGCYRCLFAYRQSRDLGSISRNAAEDMIRAILSGKKNIKEIPKLAAVKANPIFDSELEEHFIEAIRRSSTDTLKVKVIPMLFSSGKEGYQVDVNGSSWEIEPQVHVGPADGVAVDSKPDFVLRLLNEPAGGKPEHPRKPVAVFTDGFTYHKDKVDDDTHKRLAIMRSGTYHVWSFSWQDVEAVFAPKEDTRSVVLAGLEKSKIYAMQVQRFKAESIAPGTESTFRLFMEYLAHPDAEDLFGGQAKAHAWTMLRRDGKGSDAWRNEWKDVEEQVSLHGEDPMKGQLLTGRFEPYKKEGHSYLLVLAGMSLGFTNRYTPPTMAPPTAAAVLDDTGTERDKVFQQQWNDLWRLTNVMQFLPRFAVVSRKGLEEGLYQDSVPELAAVPAAASNVEAGWKDTAELLISEEEKAFSAKLLALGVPAPDPNDIGVEVSGEKGGVNGMISMEWKKGKICFLDRDNAGLADALQKKGWTVLTSESDVDVSLWGGKR